MGQWVKGTLVCLAFFLWRKLWFKFAWNFLELSEATYSKYSGMIMMEMILSHNPEFMNTTKTSRKAKKHRRWCEVLTSTSIAVENYKTIVLIITNREITGAGRIPKKSWKWNEEKPHLSGTCWIVNKNLHIVTITSAKVQRKFINHVARASWGND